MTQFSFWDESLNGVTVTCIVYIIVPVLYIYWVNVDPGVKMSILVLDLWWCMITWNIGKILELKKRKQSHLWPGPPSWRDLNTNMRQRLWRGEQLLWMLLWWAHTFTSSPYLLNFAEIWRRKKEKKRKSKSLVFKPYWKCQKVLT